MAAACAATALAGCGAAGDITRGGTVAGAALTVYSVLPQPGEGASRDIVDAEKLALSEEGATVGDRQVNFVSIGEGAAGGEDGSREAAVALRDAVADPQIVALIGPGGSDTGRLAMPLLNSAGILQVAPGAGYPGFTREVRPGEPLRWEPAGRRTLARLAGDDDAQAPALLAAATAASARQRPRVAVEQEPGPVAGALVAALRRAGARLGGDPPRADAVVYAGEDPGKAAGVADALAREAPSAAVVLPDALTRAGVADRLSAAARKRAVLVSSAPEPGSTAALRAFERRFEDRFGRRPGPYAAVGYEAMRGVLSALERAGDRAGSRQAVIDAYFADPERRATLIGSYRLQADGTRAPAPFTAFRPGGRYLLLR